MNLLFKNFFSTLRRYKAASLLNIVGLSVAFAAFAIIMMQVSHEYGYGTSDSRHERIFRVELRDPFTGSWDMNNYWGGVEQQIASIPGIEAQAELLYTSEDLVLGEGDRAAWFDDIPALRVFNDISRVFDIAMVRGDFASALEPGNVIVSERLAARLFGADDPVGKTIAFNRRDYTVAGVYRDLPRNATLQAEMIYWQRSGSVKSLFLLLGEHTDAEQVTALARQQFEQFGPIELRLNPAAELYFAADAGENSFIPRGSRTTTYLLTAIAALIVLISAINFVNFATALVPVRMRSLSTRRVMGQSRGSLRAMMLFEAVGTCLIAFVASLLLVDAVDKTPLAGLLTIGSTTLADNWPLVGRVALIALATGLAAGLYPAFYATSFRPAMVLKGSFGATAQGKRLRRVLVGAQYVISIALIVVALAIHRQNRYFGEVSLGYDQHNVLTLNLFQSGFDQQVDAIRHDLEALPGVERTAMAGGSFGSWEADYMAGMIVGDDTLHMKSYMVDVDFMELMRIPIVAGRGFREGDPVDMMQYAPGEAIPTLPLVINAAAARRYGLQVDTLLESPQRNFRVIGIAGDVVARSMHRPTEDIAFWPTANEWIYYLYIRIAPRDLPATIGAIRELLGRHASDDRWSMELHTENLNGLYAKEQKLATLVSLFSALAILISMIGVFGLILFETQYRRKEIGIRKVHGATIGEILRLFNSGFVRIVLICFVLAAPVAYYVVRRWLEGFAYRTPVHWWIFAIALLAVLLLTWLTVTLQSYRTAIENPVNSIKTE